MLEHPTETTSTQTTSQDRPRSWINLSVIVVGLAGTILGFTWLAGRVFNVVNYTPIRLADLGEPDAAASGWWRSAVIPILTLGALVAVAIERCRTPRPEQTPQLPRPPSRAQAPPGAWWLVTAAVSILWISGGAAALGSHCQHTWGAVGVWVAEVLPFALYCLALTGVGLGIAQLGSSVTAPAWFGRLDRAAPWVLIVVVVASTLWHAAEQVRLWQHFQLGYADFGLFTTELEYCLPWKEVGAARFADTRMGYHCIPMFYLLVPVYALLRSPVFLMVVGPLALNLAAVPFYQLARQQSKSGTFGLLVAFAWLALPSVSRLPYSNTYGFQSVYLAVPWLAFAFCLAFRGRWGWSHLCLVGALLCEETVCGVALGWGLYLILFSQRRRAGLVILTASILYLLLCTAVIIPSFADAGTYTRLALFGELSLRTVGERLLRPRVVLYLLALGTPLLVGLIKYPKLLIAILPSLALVLVLREPDYLNLKYWHHASFLVPLFTAAVLGVAAFSVQLSGQAKERRVTLGRALALLITVALAHQALGFSPFAQAYRPYAANQTLQERDPRLDVVNEIRARLPLDRTILASERLAAHFTDYRRVQSLSRRQQAPPAAGWNAVVMDQRDRWDPVIKNQEAQAVLAEFGTQGYQPVLHARGIVVMLRPGN